MKHEMNSKDPLSRRIFVERCARAAFGLSVLPLVPAAEAIAAPTKNAANNANNNTPMPGFGRAKNIIWLRLSGGLSHIDTFDPKTGDAKGPSKAVGTKAGFQLTEFLPKTVGVADKICVIRSMTAKVGVHAAASYLMRTSYDQRGTIVHPNLGAWAQHYLGPSHQTLPSSACINQPSRHGNGFFPATFSPLPILDPEAGLQNAASPVGAERTAARLALANDLDQDFRQHFPDENVKAYNDFYDNTLTLMRSSDLKAFDLSNEPEKLRDDYGRNKFGQGCLLARRLVQAGVRFIEVESGGWDMHDNLEDRMEDKGTEFDSAFAALVADLDAQGLLDSTLVAVTTEFGRKPNFDGDGRGHHPICFSTVLAGGGVKRGHVHGASNANGYEPSDKPMTIGSFHATIGHAAGLPLEKEVISPSGRPFTVGNKAKPALEVFA